MTDASDFGFCDAVGPGLGERYGLWGEIAAGKAAFLRSELLFSRRTLKLESETYGASALEFSNIDFTLLYGKKLGKKGSGHLVKPSIG